MRSSLLTVLAGVTAAFCFSSVFIHFVAGQFFMPLATLPLFLVLFMCPVREIWLALAASGATLGVMGFAGIFGPSTLMGVLLAFAVTAAIPAVCAGAIYATPMRTEDGTTKWVRPEVPFMVLCALGLILFYVAAIFTHVVLDKSLYAFSYEVAYKFIETTFEQLKTLNPDIDENTFNIAEIAELNTLRMPGVAVFLFVMGHYFNLLIAQWALHRKMLIAMPLPRFGDFYFPFAFVSLVSFLACIYVMGHHLNWTPETMFLIRPALVAAATPLLVQGLSAMHRFFVKKLVKLGVISVYLGLSLLMISMPVQVFTIFAGFGFINNARLYLKNVTQRETHEDDEDDN